MPPELAGQRALLRRPRSTQLTRLPSVPSQSVSGVTQELILSLVLYTAFDLFDKTRHAVVKMVVLRRRRRTAASASLPAAELQALLSQTLGQQPPRIGAHSPPPYDPNLPPRYAASSSAASFSTIRSADQDVPEVDRKVEWSDDHYGRGAPREPVVRRDSGASWAAPSTLPPSYHPDSNRRQSGQDQVITERGGHPGPTEWAYASLPGEVEQRTGLLSLLFFLCVPKARKSEVEEGKVERTTVR